MKSLGRIFHPSVSVFGVLILVTAAYLLTFFVIEKRSFWIIDNEIKFVQLQAISDSNYTDYSIAWPGAEVDPELAYQPMIFPFYSIQDGKIFASYSPVLPAVSAPLFKLFGYTGLYILPLICSVLMLVGLVKITEVMGIEILGRSITVLVAGLCTPIWFYSAVFWGHNIAVCLCIWGIYFYLRFIKQGFVKHLICGSVLLALSIYFRDELYIFCAVLAAATLFYVPGKRIKTVLVIIITMAVSIIPLWLFQWKAIGQPFGFHIGVHLFSFPGMSEHIVDRGRVLYTLFVRCSPKVWFSLILVAPFVLTFLVNPKLSKKVFVLAVPFYCLVAMASFFFVMRGYFTSDSPLAWMLQANSLFVVSPILMLAFMRYKNPEGNTTESSFVNLIWLLCIFYVVVYSLVTPYAATEGIHWGNRLLLILYPLFAILAAVNISRWLEISASKFGLAVAVVILAILASFAAQLYSVNILHKKKDFTYRLNREIQKRPESAIITDVWWVPLELYSVFYEKPIFRIRSQEQIEQLLKKLQEAGYKESLFATRTSHMRGAPAVVEVDDGDLNFFSLKFIPLEYKP